MSQAATGDAARTLDELRLDMTASAAGVERRHRPTGWVVLGILLLVGGAVALGLAVWDRLKADRQAAKAEADARELVALSARLKALESAAGTSGESLGEPIPNILSRIQRVGTQAGLRSEPTAPRSGRQGERARQAIRYDYDYEARDESPDALLRWAKLSCEEIPGLEVADFRLTPEPNQWHLKVIFSRWERTGAAAR